MIDAHVHLITQSIFREALRDWGVEEEKLADRLADMPDVSADELRAEWLEAMDAKE